MKSIKPGRGPSGLNAAGSIVAVVFGVFWTIIAFTITSGQGIFGVIFPLFGVLFVILGIVQAVYHYRNATNKDRYSIFDITDTTEEGDPAAPSPCSPPQGAARYCPYCGAGLPGEFRYCPHCGKEQPPLPL